MIYWLGFLLWLPLGLLDGLLPGSFIGLQSLQFQFKFLDVLLLSLIVLFVIFFSFIVFSSSLVSDLILARWATLSLIFI